MADIELVIKISSYDKEWITNGYYIPEEINIRISEAIANGIPLPNGHGRLIDADDVDNHIFGFVNLSSCPTIIEADKAESKDKE